MRALAAGDHALHCSYQSIGLPVQFVNGFFEDFLLHVFGQTSKVFHALIIGHREPIE
jgi:hypothetical protein